MKKTKVFIDTEFTGLHKDTTLISIGCVSEDNKTFYAELTDYDTEQVDEWINENVIPNLIEDKEKMERLADVTIRGTMEEVRESLTIWLKQFEKVDIWSDCLAYDWVLFNHIFGHAFDIPSNVNYIPFDICTVFEIKGIDPDISREEYLNIKTSVKHNSLYDAKVIKACYEKLMY